MKKLLFLLCISSFFLEAKDFPKRIPKPDMRSNEFFQAIEKGLSRKVRRFIQDGKYSPDSVNQGGSSALYWAVESEKPKVVKVLLEAGADPNASKSIFYYPLHACVSCPERVGKEIFTLLSEAGADPEFQDESGKTVIDLALEKKKFYFYAFLLEHGLKDSKGKIIEQLSRENEQLKCQLEEVMAGSHAGFIYPSNEEL